MAKRTVKISGIERKIFVLDTSVIIFDHTAIKNFAEHDVVIPITVLEELDQFKKGNDTKNFAAREFIRYVDAHSGRHSLQEWTSINGPKRGQFKIEMHTSATLNAEKIFDERKPDHRILNTALYVAEHHPQRKVVLVTKDINLRIKAKSLNLNAEDYETGKIKTLDELHSGALELTNVSPAAIAQVYANDSIARTSVLKKTRPLANQYFILKNESQSVLTRYYAEEDILIRIGKPRHLEYILKTPNKLLHWMP